MTIFVNYKSNNSGGTWWLTDEDWHSLAAAGWIVRWAKNDTTDRIIGNDPDGRYMGALATSAYKIVNEGVNPHRALKEAIREFNMVTSCNASDLGCYSCCGVPHHFEVVEGDNPQDLYGSGRRYIDSYSPSAPQTGDEYDY